MGPDAVRSAGHTEIVREAGADDHADNEYRGIAITLGLWGNATAVNIVYSSRGFWSGVFVWLIGHWFSNQERRLGRAAMVRRMLGSALLLGAIVVIVLG